MKQPDMKSQQSMKKPAAPAGKPPNVNAMLKNSNFSTSSIKTDHRNDDDDDDDTRDMTGRIRTAAGVEVI